MRMIDIMIICYEITYTIDYTAPRSTSSYCIYVDLELSELFTAVTATSTGSGVAIKKKIWPGEKNKNPI
jgi:hypothetical protein